VIWRSGDVIAAEPRLGDDVDVIRSVVDGVGPATTVLVDAPRGVAGAVDLARAISEHLRADGVAVTTVPPDRVLAAARDRSISPHTSEPASPKGHRIAALIAATGSLRSPLRRATFATLIGLMAVTGIRVGEAIALDNGDVDLSLSFFPCKPRMTGALILS